MAQQLILKPKLGRLAQKRSGKRTRRNSLTATAFLIAFICSLFANRSIVNGQDTTLSSKLSSVAPATCLTWYQWSNPFNADATSENSIDRMMAEPDVNKFCKDFTDKLGQLPAILIPDQAPAEIKQAAAVLVPQLVDGLLRKQGCFFIEGFELTDLGPQNLKVGLVLEVGDDVAESLKSIELLLQIAGAPLEKLDLNGQQSLKIIAPPGGPFSEIAIVQQDQYLVAATGVELAQEIVTRMQTGQVAPWLGQLQAEQKYLRASAVGKIDVAMLRKQLMTLADDEVAKSVKALGFDNLEHVVFSGGYAQKDYAQQFKLNFDGTPTGIFAAIDGKGLTAEDIAHFPSDSVFAAALSVDMNNVLDQINNILIQMEPEAAIEMAGSFTEFQIQTGVDLKKLIGNFGPTITMHNGYGDGLMTGVQLRSELEDSQWFDKTVSDLVGLAARGTGAAIDSVEQNGKTVKSMHFGSEPIPVEPSWFIDGNHVTMALFPSVLGSATNPKLTTPLVNDSSFGPYLELFGPSPNDGKLIGFSYFESDWAYQMLYGYACMGGAMARNVNWSAMGMPWTEEQTQKVKEHFMELQLPSFRSVGKHLTPEISIIRKEKDAIVFESHSMFASSNATVALPGIAVGMLLPAVQQVRQAARRTTSANNLRQFALGVLNYESAFGKFPTGDGPVKPGGPAVSWRVKILPFIEANNLYDMYNFDEPWDSENNMRVARQMPECFQNPAGIVPEGHTVYRGVGGTSGVFGVGPDGKPVARTFASLIDGSSNTILMLEVPDEMSVPWTKPDGGINPDEIQPWQLQGNYPGGFNASFCDGSTHFISRFIDDKAFENLLKFDDGNVVEGDF